MGLTRQACARELDRRLRAVFRRGVDRPLPDGEFDSLALALFAHQYRFNRPYRRFCDGFGVTPDGARTWRDIPAIPTDVFKTARLAAFPPGETVRVFETSGTTGRRPGRLSLDTTALYEASLLPNFQAHLLPEGGRMAMVFLAPAPGAAPHSSLVHMLDTVRRRLGRFPPGMTNPWFVREGAVEAGRLAGVLRRISRGRKSVMILGTAFSFVHFRNFCAGDGLRFRLPPGSRIMETGGYKGRSRELSPGELYSGLHKIFGVPENFIVNEYGMTEMGSQFYDGNLRRAHAGLRPVRAKAIPPWVRTEALHPETLAPLPPGRTGLLKHVDLANRGSVAALLTGDLGRLTGNGLEVFGRASGAGPRGCSLAAEGYVTETRD